MEQATQFRLAQLEIAVIVLTGLVKGLMDDAAGKRSVLEEVLQALKGQSEINELTASAISMLTERLK